MKIILKVKLNFIFKFLNKIETNEAGFKLNSEAHWIIAEQNKAEKDRKQILFSDQYGSWESLYFLDKKFRNLNSLSVYYFKEK